MQNKPKYYHLGEKISEYLLRGITISDDVVHYIDSTFSNPSHEAFSRIISDPSNCETETVFELIFYPDRQAQEYIEANILKNQYNTNDIESAIDYLSQKKMTVPVTFPDQRGKFSVPLTVSVIRQFMVRLNLTRQIHERFLETLSCFVANAADNLRLRVLLRNCRTEFPVLICDFLCKCIEKMYGVSPYFWNVFTFLLNFFEYIDPGEDVFSSLMREKRIILHSIAKAEKTEQALENNSVEALMLKGTSILSINIADAREKIVLIDHICISIFGKTEMFDHATPIDTMVRK